MNIDNLRPNNQNKLFYYNSLFNNLINLYENKKLPNKIYFSGPKGIGKATFAYHLINYIFSKEEKFAYNHKNFEINNLNKSYNLVLNNSHPNFHLIDVLEDKNVIEISQIREMINYANKSSFNNKERIVLIDNGQNLNSNSLNALLKIIEEPNDNVYFILISDNNNKIPNTLVSRCIKFNLFLNLDQSIDVTNKIIENNIFNYINEELISHYDKTGDFIKLIKFSLSSKSDLTNTNLKNFLINLINEQLYKKNIYIKKNIFKFVEYYFLQLAKKRMPNHA